MSLRNITLITKNANQPGKSLPGTSNVEIGEPLVNTADGKLFYRGYISGTGSTTYLPSLEDNAYFEVGSHVSQLKVDDKIKGYDGATDFTGQILSGTSNGFVLGSISSLQNSIDSYLTGASFDNSTETLTLSLNGGRSDVSVQLDDNVTTGGTLINSTLYFDTRDQLSAYTVDLSALDVNDTYVTGGTYDNNSTDITLTRNDGSTVTIDLSSLDVNDTFVTGGTFSNSNEEITFTNNDGSTFTVDLSTLDINDTFITGVTFDGANTLSLDRNDGTTLTEDINSFDTLDINSLTAGTVVDTSLTSGRVVYADSNNQLSTDAGLKYDDANDKLVVGDGGLEVGSGGDSNTNGVGDVIIHGDLTIYGESTSAQTSELYIEDHNITLNYNPDNDTYASSLGAGFNIQDGLGVSGATGDTVFFRIAQTGGTPTDIAEAYDNRFWNTDLKNIMVGSTGGTTNGMYLLKETDVLDGGSY